MHMHLTRRTIGLAWTALHILFWIQLSNGVPLLHRPRTTSGHPNTNHEGYKSTLSTRDNANSTASSNGTTSVSPSIRDDVESMLQLIGPDAESRFVSINLPTAFGANDPVQSNKDLSQLVDRAFLSGQAKSGNSGWVDTYIQCLIDVANTLPSLDNQTVLIDDYYNSMRTLAPVQAKLVQAYKAAKNESTTNIGVQLSSGQLIDALTMRTVDEWAASVFNGSDSGEGSSHSGFDSKDYTNYLSLNASYTKILPKYNKLETANKIASEGWLLREMINQSPAIFNLSMITSGDPSSLSADYSPAWSAIIINSTSVAVTSSNSDVSGNLDHSLHDGTDNSTTYATSINNEAPVSTSISFNSTTESSDSGSSSATPTSTNSLSSKQNTQSPTSASAVSLAHTATATGSARRSRIRRAIVSTGSRIQRRALAASNALLLAASAGSTSAGTTSSAKNAGENAGKYASLPGMKEVASAANFAAEPDVADGVSDAVSFAPLLSSSTATRTSSSSFSTSVNGVLNSNAPNASDPLSGIPDVPLQTTSSLFAMTLQEGAWSNNRLEFLQFIAQNHPEIYRKYFFGNASGNGTTGDGPLGKHWTHIFLLVTVKANSTEIETSQVVGMVYDVLPGLVVPSTLADADPDKQKANFRNNSTDTSSSTNTGSSGQSQTMEDKDSGGGIGQSGDSNGTGS
ncbi:hypothetical protein C8J55DRAFT_487064 [Lentinula edodes]|uniref:Uncharacterized protein n=1 Tax=Lentinula lateritia TaxID=40482 RepID=A0A9W9ARB1_9AGAR|nr:hypothetical protein C8J55DRAFT_487064 [Lentinula edodes]